MMKENFYSSRDRNISKLDKQTSRFLNPLLTKCEVTSKYTYCFLPCFDQSVFQQPWQAHRWLLNLLNFTSFTFPFLFSPAYSDHVYQYSTAKTIQILDSVFTALAVNVAHTHRNIDMGYYHNLLHTSTSKYHLGHISQCIFSVLIHTALQPKAQLESITVVQTRMT